MTPQGKRSIATRFVPLLLTLVTSPCLAITDYFDMTLEQLLQIEVLSVSKKPESVAGAPAAIYVVTTDQIQRSGVTNIPDALRLVPGVQVARSDSNTWAVSIRGFNSALSNKLLVLVDGRSIYNPVFGGTLWEAHNLMLEDVERIEVIRGPGGSLWGANAVNGVINIITKSSSDTQGNLASIIYGNEEKGTVNARHGGRIGDHGTYRVYVKGFRVDESRKPGGGDTYDAWDGFRSGFRADWGDKFMLQGDVYRTNTEQLRIDYSLLPPYSPVKQQDIRYQGGHILGRWTDKRPNNAQLSLQAYINWTQRDEPFNFNEDRITYDLDAQYNFAQRGVHELIIGGGLRLLNDEKEGSRNVEFNPRKRDDALYSFFVQDKIILQPDKWFLTLGSKFEYNDYSGYEPQPNIRLQWNANSTQTFWSAISRAVRTPTAIEEDITSTLATAASARAAIEPNDHFHSEELVAYELGYRHQINPRLSLDIATFYNDYQHLTTTRFQEPRVVVNNIDPPHIFIPVQFTNEMDGTTSGVEVVTNWSLGESLNLMLNYSYLHMELEHLDPAQKSAEYLYPRHQAGIAVFYNLGNQWTLDTTATYVDELITTPSYIRWNVILGKQFGNNLRLNLIAKNLGDSHHPEFGSMDDINAAEIERSLFAKVTWSF
jgi:iron complex outermembrane receptor protein